MDISISRPTRHFTSISRYGSRKTTFIIIYLLGLLVALATVMPVVSSQTTTPSTTSTPPTISANNTTPTTATTSSPSTQPTSTSGEENGGVGGLYDLCKAPLIPNTLRVVSDSCNDLCCIPCPVSFAFYEPNSLSMVYTVTSYIRIASGISCAILALAYLILPSRRQHPHAIVTCFALIMIPFDALGIVWLRSKEDLLCHSPYEYATMSNSTFCGVQGTIIVYIALVMLCLAVLLIANLHVLTVFQSVIIQRNMTKLIIFTFILPLASIIPVALRKEFEYPGFGSVCFIKSDIAGPFFFYPLSIFACIGALMHLGTIGYMVKATIRATATSVNSAALRSHSDSQSNAPMSATKLRLLKARNITRILKKQWRAGFFAICLIAVDMTYWLFYFIEAKKAIGVNADTPWLTAWAGCILYADPNADRQSACLDVARPNVPKFAWIVTTEVFPASLGLITFITFGSKLAFWQDVFSALFCGLRKRDSTVFVMNDITRDSEQGKLGRSELQSSENFDEKQTGHRVQDYNDKGGIYSGESSLNPSAYNSRDILSNTFSQDFTKENAIPSMPSPPTATPYNTKAALGGPTRKASVRIVEEREPILYVNPASKLQSEKENNENQKKIAIEKEHQRAKLVSEGSEPWPSWPTTTTTSSVPRSFSESFSPARRRPDLTVCTEGDIPTPNHHNLLSPTTQHMPSFVPSPAPVYSTPTSPGFYNFEDIGISPDFGQHEQVNHGPSIIPARTSSRSPHYQGRSQQSGIQYSGKRSLDYQSRNHGSASTTPVSPYYPASPTSSSPPPIPPKSQSRKTSLT